MSAPNEANGETDESLATLLPITDTAQLIDRDSLVAFLTGRFRPDTHDSFVLIDEIHADRAGLYIHKDVYQAFLKMSEAAKHDGINLVIRSATRNFASQKTIWERKWQGKVPLSSGISAVEFSDPKARAQEILKYSSMPGTSRHHWGTDIDLNAFNNRYFETGPGHAMYQWMISHAASFGFCQPYTSKDAQRPKGYEEEKWHWTYVPIAKELQNYAAQYLEDSNIFGFDGADQAPHLQVVNNYVLGINPDCY